MNYNRAILISVTQGNSLKLFKMDFYQNMCVEFQ